MKRTIHTTIFLLLAFGGLLGCNRDQDKTTPVGQEQGRGAAQDYPSTRNMEQPNPAVGGNNSATNGPAPTATHQDPPSGSSSR